MRAFDPLTCLCVYIYMHVTSRNWHPDSFFGYINLPCGFQICLPMCKREGGLRRHVQLSKGKTPARAHVLYTRGIKGGQATVMTCWARGSPPIFRGYTCARVCVYIYIFFSRYWRPLVSIFFLRSVIYWLLSSCGSLRFSILISSFLIAGKLWGMRREDSFPFFFFSIPGLYWSIDDFGWYN